MKKGVKLHRNIYIILLFVLLLAVASQFARSKFVLEFSHNENVHQQYQQVKQKYLASLNEEPSTTTAISDRNYCVLYDSRDTLSVGIKDNSLQVLEYMQQPYTTVDLDINDVDVSECQAILMTSSLNRVESEIQSIIDYVEDGGYMYVMRLDNPSPVFNQIYRKLGFLNFSYLKGEYGIELTSNVLINQKGIQYDGDFIYNDVLIGEIEDSAELLATTINHTPLMWKKTFGDGAFLVFNGSSLDTKESRGLIAGGISMLEPDYIYPIFNTKLFYIDDFPAPIPQGINDVIYKDYQMDITTFFQNIWWPQMIRVAKLNDIKYTAMVIQTYGDDVIGPFQSREDEELHNLIGYGREVIKSGGEIGIHGYNHQSLQMDPQIADYFDYNEWQTSEDMKESIRTVLQYIKRAFPNYNVMSYVPPSNVLSSEGRQALVDTWPNLAVISSLYMTDPFERSYVQEFQITSDGIIEMPRVTSGYFDTEYNKWLEANTITSIGVFSHFIHPDDLLDKERGRQQTWESLYKDFEDLLERLHSTYPWLRSITSTQAAVSVANQLQSDMDVTKDKNKLQVTTTSESAEQYFILRTDKKIKMLEHCIVEKIDKDIYLVTAFNKNFSIGLGG
ncbi:DUF2194 domain-containing protein [Ureibacillus manganicus]|uniref:DUF2194 domain-containing protein n=1 Tax=Ureibacillus manganicus TaxID=1266064 RepID=UPI00055CBCAC|nr:DUF2194 domain-containing protein [Ureibacillus manganicus]